MKHKFIKSLFAAGIALPCATIFPLTSCGLTSKWDWLSATKENTRINYCLLIGQNEHTDSIERTRGTRLALGTFDDSEETKTRTKDNPNIAKPVPGKIKLLDKQGKKHTFEVNEIEQLEQKSITGNAWDPIAANGTAGTWIAKHGNNITFFVSNNDAMAEGAMWASNWIPGLPIFGYDANSTTLQWINSGHITGTVDQNPSSQAAVAMLMFRNMLEDRDAYWETIKQNKYDPTAGHNYGDKSLYTPLHTGFHVKEDQPRKEDTYGYVNSDLFTDWERRIKEDRQVLAHCTPIAKLEGTDINNIKDFIKPDGTAKQPTDMFDQSTYIIDAKPSKKYNICHTYSNKSEAFLVATMRPYYNEYARRIGINPDIVEGDGTDETLVLNQISARKSEFDGYFICMAKTTTALQYIQLCAKKAYDYENATIGAQKRKIDKFKDWSWNDKPDWTGWDKWEDRLDTPLFFWIRKPTKDDGTTDMGALNNKYFKYTYYIGADSVDGGTAQGNLITTAITKWYQDSLEKKE